MVTVDVWRRSASEALRVLRGLPRGEAGGTLRQWQEGLQLDRDRYRLTTAPQVK